MANNTEQEHMRVDVEYFHNVVVGLLVSRDNGIYSQEEYESEVEKQTRKLLDSIEAEATRREQALLDELEALSRRADDCTGDTMVVKTKFIELKRQAEGEK